jgi:hypothetical protein
MQTKIIDEIKAYILYSVFLYIFPKIVPFLDDMGKCGTAGQAADDNIIRSRKCASCVPDN